MSPIYVFLIDVWIRHAGTRDFCPPLAALVSPEQNIFSSPDTILIHFVPIAQQAGQEVVQGRLSLNVCLCWCSIFAFVLYYLQSGISFRRRGNSIFNF
jgi:hypothetical protein